VRALLLFSWDLNVLVIWCIFHVFDAVLFDLLVPFLGDIMTNCPFKACICG